MTTVSHPDKRDRLLQAAKDLIHRQGFASTTLADVAGASGVPLGNMYYYFKTKESLAAAVIESRLEEMIEGLDAAASAPSPEGRLQLYLERLVQKADSLARYGCPFGCLAQEFERRGGAIGRRSSMLLARQRDWLIHQFTEIGFGPSRARALGLELQAGMHGAIVLGLGFGDSGLIRTRLRALSDWVKGVAVRPTGG